MMEYFPWSATVLSECLAEYKLGRFSVLDIELGGECNFTCIYCDSPEKGSVKFLFQMLSVFLDQVSSNGFISVASENQPLVITMNC